MLKIAIYEDLANNSRMYAIYSDISDLINNLLLVVGQLTHHVDCRRISDNLLKTHKYLIK